MSNTVQNTRTLEVRLDLTADEYRDIEDIRDNFYAEVDNFLVGFDPNTFDVLRLSFFARNYDRWEIAEEDLDID